MSKHIVRLAPLFWFFALVKAGSIQVATEEPPLKASYIGAQACGQCHREKFEGFRKTAHHLTSRLPTAESILGSFDSGRAVLTTRDPNLWFKMSTRGNSFFQTATGRVDGKIRQHTERIDIVIGSGKIGQSFLFWKEQQLYQLPVSYLTRAGTWMNSPGYPDGQAIFDRPVHPSCLECHATYFEVISDGQLHLSNSYVKDDFVLGISCERCHGPGSLHVLNPKGNPETRSTSIVHPGRINRSRQLDLCSQCHSVARPLKVPFSYRPGERLGAYKIVQNLREQNKVGVHSNNQLARLSRSKCFKTSQTMICVSCHNPHQLERGQLALFSQRCLQCHQAQSCGMMDQLGHRIKENCIDCHMPMNSDLHTGFATHSGFEYPFMRDHVIAVYPELTRDFIERPSP